MGPWDPNLPHGVLTSPPNPAGTPGGIGEKPTPPGTLKDINQVEINKEILESQQDKPIHINLGWLLSLPDTPSKQALIDLVAALNKVIGA